MDGRERARKERTAQAGAPEMSTARAVVARTRIDGMEKRILAVGVLYSEASSLSYSLYVYPSLHPPPSYIPFFSLPLSSLPLPSPLPSILYPHPSLPPSFLPHPCPLFPPRSSPSPSHQSPPACDVPRRAHTPVAMYLISAIPAAILVTPYFGAPRCTMLAGGGITAKRWGINGGSGEGGGRARACACVRSGTVAGLVGNDFLVVQCFLYEK